MGRVITAMIAVALAIGAPEMPIRQGWDMGTVIYEDGSWVAPNGTMGCLEGAICND